MARSSLRQLSCLVSKNPAFRALYLARQNEFRFFRLINTIFFIFGYLFLPEKFSFCPKIMALRVWGLQPPSPVARMPMGKGEFWGNRKGEI